VTVEPASTLELTRLREVFNEGFSDYLVPLQLDEVAFRGHVDGNDIDLDCSQVAIDDRPAAVALIARRGAAGWVGGMATAPSYRRRGLGERALLAGLEAARRRGCREMWLEVIDSNRGAIALYEKLGFDLVREVVVWSLPAGRPGVPASPPGVPASRPVEPEAAQAWIAVNRESREPWQRADESVAKMRARGAALRGLIVDRDGEVAAAVVFRDDADPVTTLQIAAVDEGAAADALLAAAGQDRGLRLSNAPVGEAPARALARLGARPVVRQREMRLAL
jgi:ribosomal protein S18 acetylase RimI-like enzyme